MIAVHLFEASQLMLGISIYDRAFLEISFEYFTNDNINCHKKIEKLAKHFSLHEATQKVQVNNKCLELSEKPRGQTDEFDFFCCPCRVVNPQIFQFIKMAQMLKVGILPFEGGFMNQPAPLMEILDIVSNLLSQYEDKETKKQQAQRKSKK